MIIKIGSLFVFTKTSHFVFVSWFVCICILVLFYFFGPMGVYLEVKSKTEIIFDHPLNLRAYGFNIQMIEFKQYFGGEGQDGREEGKCPELN